MAEDLLQLTLQLRNKQENDKKYAKFHGDQLIGNQVTPSVGLTGDLKSIISPSNWSSIGGLLNGYFRGTGLDGQSAAKIAGSLSDYSKLRQKFIDDQVKSKYDKMLHPPLTYLGDAFQYRTPDGKFNSVLNPHLGQAGAPYAKTVPSKTAPLGALPDPGDIFDRLMARKEGGRESKSGLSSMLIYHATIIIHDIFRTNDNDKNISDSSSYLDLSPLYGYTEAMQREVRDDKYKLGHLKPDTFAEDRLLRQPPGVCIMLVMYNRYHNYAAKQLYRINENGRFSVPAKYADSKLVAVAKNFYKPGAALPIGLKSFDRDFEQLCKSYETALKAYEATDSEINPIPMPKEGPNPANDDPPKKPTPAEQDAKRPTEVVKTFRKWEKAILDLIESWNIKPEERTKFETGYKAAWAKLDDDLFNTARLITCGIYIQISVHDYLRALMGFHQFDTNFTLDPRTDFDQRKTTRGIGNQVTVEFNLLYRFHCAISLKDERYAEEYIKQELKLPNPANASLQDFLGAMANIGRAKAKKTAEGRAEKPWQVEFGIPDPEPTALTTQESPNGVPLNGHGSSQVILNGASAKAGTTGANTAKETPIKSTAFKRNKITNLFDDNQMIDELTKSMDDPISNFGPCNTPKCLKPVEIMGILQARRWECGTLNDFREFFEMPRHATFESVTKNVEVQNALRDLYEHPDKVELYPGIFCESDEYMGLDPGPKEATSALWAAIFSDAITLVRSDRFYTVDWNTNSLTSWGMNEVTPNNEIFKSSVFHRLIQRAFPGWFQYDSIRFFHPFYTKEKNAEYAQAQGYALDFGPRPVIDPDLLPSPGKPVKPAYLAYFKQIEVVLENEGSIFKHPALRHPWMLPRQLREVLQPGYQKDKVKGKKEEQPLVSEHALSKYLDDLMREIILRESISMTSSTFQVDITRDFAIPVVTRYVADFLGFGHRLRTEKNPGGSYSENDIYQHITNCHVFLSYNADETKIFKRGKEFKDSMAFLIKLTSNGNIASAQWPRSWFSRAPRDPMTNLGLTIARDVLLVEPDTGKAAAILLLVCLDFAYSSVVSFTAVMEHFMSQLYEAADNLQTSDLFKEQQASTAEEPTQLRFQHLAFGEKDENDTDKRSRQIQLEKLVRDTARATVRLPIVRVATESRTYDWEVPAEKEPFEDKRSTWSVNAQQAVILDVRKATVGALERDAKREKAGKSKPKGQNEYINNDFLTSQSVFAGHLNAFQPPRLATFTLTAMVGFVARMKNLRRGHDAQGKLKRIFLDWTAEGYSNFMASERMEWISKKVESLPQPEHKSIFTMDILRPDTDSYLTPSWDEMVPFPMTWKVRFDGFGKSDYSIAATDKTPRQPYGRVKTAWLPDDSAPWYQAQGPSHVGGSFADTQCICSSPGKECLCPRAGKKTGDLKKEAETRVTNYAAEIEPTYSQGCGAMSGA